MIPVVYTDTLSFKPVTGFCILYMYTLSDGTSYIGMTMLPMEVRHNRHMRGLSGYAIDSRLREGHTLRILEVVPFDVARSEEERLIHELRTYAPYGWNHMPKVKPVKQPHVEDNPAYEPDLLEGKEFTPISCFTVDGKLVKKYRSFEDACRDVRGRSYCTAILRSASTNGRTAYGYVWGWQ